MVTFVFLSMEGALVSSKVDFRSRHFMLHFRYILELPRIIWSISCWIPVRRFARQTLSLHRWCVHTVGEKDLMHKLEAGAKACVAYVGVDDFVHASLASARACNTTRLEQCVLAMSMDEVRCFCELFLA